MPQFLVVQSTCFDAVRGACFLKFLVDSAADFVVLIIQPNPDAKYLLEPEGAIVKYAGYVGSLSYVEQFEQWLVSIAFVKLREHLTINPRRNNLLLNEWNALGEKGCKFQYNILRIDCRRI